MHLAAPPPILVADAHIPGKIIISGARIVQLRQLRAAADRTLKRRN
jgi:hypothetical protein